jgi:hypothetical protein
MIRFDLTSDRPFPILAAEVRVEIDLGHQARLLGAGTREDMEVIYKQSFAFTPWEPLTLPDELRILVFLWPAEQGAAPWG